MARYCGDNVMPWGKHEGERLERVPASYLGWLLDQDWLQDDLRCDVEAELEDREAERLRQAEELLAAVPDDLPRGTPKTVCGIALGEYDAGTFEQAVNRGELVLTPDEPVASVVPEAWRRWCEVNGLPHRVRKVTWDEIREAIEGREGGSEQ